MLERKAVTRFSVIAILVYAVLTWTWPTFDHLYARHFRAVGNIAFSQFWFWSNAKVDFLDLNSETLRREVNTRLPASLPDDFQLPQAGGVADTLMILKNRDTPLKPGFLRTSSRLIGYTPTAVMLSLCLATPIAWRRRWWLLFWGMILVHLAIVVRLTALLLDAGFADPAKAFAIFRPGKFMADVIARADTILADNPTFSYNLSVFIWVVLLFLIQWLHNL